MWRGRVRSWEGRLLFGEIQLKLIWGRGSIGLALGQFGIDVKMMNHIVMKSLF